MRQEERNAMLAAADVHWWYRGRRRIVRAELDLLELPAGAHLLDVGCAGGQTLDVLSEYGAATGVDPDPASVTRARRRGHDVVEGGLPALPFPDSAFDVCTCLDVLEHLEDDHGALVELARVTTPRGLLLVTVPAYEALWSQHDEVNEHVRRYRGRTLRGVAARSGWQVERMSYFNTFLLPPAAAVRLAGRRKRPPEAGGESELSLTPRGLNGALEIPLRAEAALLRHGFRLPAGLSLLAVLSRD